VSSFRLTLASLVDDFARHGEQTAIVAPRGVRQQRTSYGQLASLSRRFAAELEARHVTKGDRVILWGNNSAEWVAAFFGCVLRGVLPVPVDAGSLPEFVRRVETEVTPKLIVTGAERLPVFRGTKSVLALEDLGQTITTQFGGPEPDLRETDPVQIVFTSGTTGEPKGVVHTHKNVLASLRPIETEMHKYLKYERIFHPLRFLHTLPLSHVFGQFMGLWIPPLLAAEIHYEPRLVAGDLIERIHRRNISALISVPRVLDLMEAELLSRFPNLRQRVESSRGMKAWERWWHFRDVHRLFGLKYWAFICGGAALPPAAEAFWNSLGFVVIQGYGMTETTALVSLNHPFRSVQGTIGQVLPGREVQLSEEGEVLVRGDTISNATWQGGQLTESNSEWLATGDLASRDEKGNLQFRGRKKDVIVTSSGLNIHPEDLEGALQRQPGVKTAAVVEVSAEYGPEPLAVLVMQPDTDANEAISRANAQLADFQQIRRSMVWPEPDLPRTSTGKVLRREIVRRVESGEFATTPTDGDLNLDSLGRVELQARLEQQYGVALDDTALQKVQTSKDVQAVLQSQVAVRPEQHIYPRWPWNRAMQVVRSVFIELVAMRLVRFLARPLVRNHVKSWPAAPVLIVANHVTSYDVPFILYALPPRIRKRVAVAMSGEMILDWRRARNQRNWLLNLVAPFQYILVTALFNVFPLPQYSGFRRSFAHAGEAMDQGYSVLVFPEGKRSPDGSLLPFKSGTGLLWKELGVTALPVYLHGLGRIKVENERWFRSGNIMVSAGEPLQLTAGASPQELTDILREGITRERDAQGVTESTASTIPPTL
jgi:long-chain acyl-CoA synthetase